VQPAQEWLNHFAPAASTAPPGESIDKPTAAKLEERKALLRQFLQWRAGQTVKSN
jgi:hypothetical protein